MKNCSLKGSSIKECHFTNTILSNADFSHTVLPKTVFFHCDLCKADFSTSMQYEIDPSVNKVTKAKFSLPEAATLLKAFDITIV